ncbi:MAG: hypothetical protein COT73_11555 [Bdellovibrio sp. CG10_big_fil_rev_8_21_14_0_10_47_8]|nr:MAG: hypothetical protein COT73_11555 [Bdellovibrio sp. CG10_big_fil_rev_8_21_14_0_10_47_8]
MKTNQNALLFSVLALCSALILASCGGAKDIDKISDAQSCLDNATAAEAANCVEMVNGIESQGAYLIRCVGKFVKEGYTSPSKIADALSEINAGSGATASTSMIAALAFTAESTTTLNYESSEQALTYCTTAQSKGLIFLAGLAQTASVINYLAGSVLSGADLQTNMATFASDPIAQAAVGTAVVAMYASNCSTGQSTAGSYCDQFSSAIDTAGGTSNTSAIGLQAMTCYSNPAAAGCTGY